jgi:hypothetical protein
MKLLIRASQYLYNRSAKSARGQESAQYKRCQSAQYERCPLCGLRCGLHSGTLSRGRVSHLPLSMHKTDAPLLRVHFTFSGGINRFLILIVLLILISLLNPD